MDSISITSNGKEEVSSKSLLTKTKDFIDFINAIKEEMHEDTVIYIYKKMVANSAPFDVNELWEHTLKRHYYIEGSAKYIIKCGGDVNHAISADFYTKIKYTPLSAAIENKDFSSIGFIIEECYRNLKLSTYTVDDVLIDKINGHIVDKRIANYTNDCIRRGKRLNKAEAMNIDLECKPIVTQEELENIHLSQITI